MTFAKKIKESSLVPLRFGILMVLFFLIQSVFQTDLAFLGILPLKIQFLHGVLFSPLIHGNVFHLISNLIPLLVLGTSLYFFYDRRANQVILQCYFLTNLIVWFGGRSYFHIGASGLVYGLAFFMISLGIFRGTLKSIFISATVIFFYGGIIYGIVPTDKKISWESHLAGTAVGIVTAFQVSRKQKISSF
jgi:membrane associated rhomboid family serine protease